MHTIPVGDLPIARIENSLIQYDTASQCTYESDKILVAASSRSPRQEVLRGGLLEELEHFLQHKQLEEIRNDAVLKERRPMI